MAREPQGPAPVCPRCKTADTVAPERNFGRPTGAWWCCVCGARPVAKPTCEACKTAEHVVPERSNGRKRGNLTGGWVCSKCGLASCWNKETGETYIRPSAPLPPIRVSDVEKPDLKKRMQTTKAWSGDSMPCVICSSRCRTATASYIHLCGGGALIMPTGECDPTCGQAQGGCLGLYPIGNECLRKNPKLKPYVLSKGAPWEKTETTS